MIEDKQELRVAAGGGEPIALNFVVNYRCQMAGIDAAYVPRQFIADSDGRRVCEIKGAQRGCGRVYAEQYRDCFFVFFYSCRHCVLSLRSLVDLADSGTHYYASRAPNGDANV